MYVMVPPLGVLSHSGPSGSETIDGWPPYGPTLATLYVGAVAPRTAIGVPIATPAAAAMTDPMPAAATAALRKLLISSLPRISDGDRAAQDRPAFRVAIT